VIRIAFRAPPAHWQGGRNYLWNLLYALGQRERGLQPVIIARTEADVSEYTSLPGVDVIRPSRWSPGKATFYAGRATKYLLGIDVVERLELSRARVQLYSHAPPLGKRFGIPSLYWIPDVQHRRLPHQFSRRERWQRDQEMRDAARTARIVIASSHAAKRDIIELVGDRVESKLRVLQFVAQPRSPAPIALADLASRYPLPKRFLFLPNQWWKHKNHALVVDALAHASDVHVVVTGATTDYRHPEHHADVMLRARALGIADRFVVLGAIPFVDMISLMAASVAVVNPSLFEGWSTTVEESRTLGKRLVLSDIDVHREQAPPRARYFAPDDARALADAMTATWNESFGDDELAAAQALTDLARRTEAFAASYEAIVREALGAR
jgi:hypothetical protein